MSILWTIIIGFLVGLVAKLLTPGYDPAGLIITILLGIGGAFAAATVGRGAGWYEEGEPASFLAAVIGAVLLLVLFRAFAGETRTTT